MTRFDPAFVMIPGIDLVQFERTIYGRDGSPNDYQKCGQALLELLLGIRSGRSLFGYDDQHVGIAHTRLAGAVSHLLMDRNFPIGDDAFMAILSYAEHLRLLFRASAYENMDHIINAAGVPAANGQLQFANRGLLMLFLCWSLDSDIDVDIDHLFKESPVGAHAMLVSLLSGISTISERAYARRVALMARVDLLDARPLPSQLLNAASEYYMHCTYADVPNKHACKPIINKWFREVAFREGAKENFWQAVQKARPTIVVCLEWFHVHHAMYRCYYASLLQLKKRFRLVAIYRPSETDDEAIALFDKAVPMPGEYVSIQNLIEAINAESPDIIYYPSIGMGPNYLAASNLRLAPLQVISPGHPASSHSPTIDYIISERDILGIDSNYTERVCGLDTGVCRFMPRLGFTPVRPDAVGAIRNIAIPAMAAKLTPPFLQTLMRIKIECPHVIFHFFPNMITMKQYVVEQELRRWFPDCVIYARDDYAPYMENLGKCQLALDTFPFGGTNSTIDCLLMGVPIICLEGNDASNRSTASMIRRLRMGFHSFINHDIDSYAENAIYYIKNGFKERYIPSVEAINKEFFSERPEAVKDDFLMMFEAIWKHKVAADALDNQ